MRLPKNTSRALAATAATVALALSGSGAQAAVVSTVDTDDAPVTGDGNITVVTVDNGLEKLTVKAKVARLTVGRTNLVATITPVAAETPVEEPVEDPVDPVDPADPADPVVEGPAYYTLSSELVPVGKGKSKQTKVVAVLADDTGAPVSCAGAKATLSKGRNGQSQLQVPQSCLVGDPSGTWEVEVSTVDGAGEVIDTAGPVTATLG